MRRRLQKRIYIPLPDGDARRALLLNLLEGQPSRLSDADVERIVRGTEGCVSDTSYCPMAVPLPLVVNPKSLATAVDSCPSD